MKQNRAEGVLLGLACGDALGRPVEFKSAAQITDEFGTLTEMVGNGTWGQPAGTITDDTDQALCIASSLAGHGAFDPADIAARFVEWYDSGPFDIGNMTRRSIRALKRGQAWDEAGQQVWDASAEGSNAGNGSVMRCPPLAVAFRDDLDRLVTASRESSLITHADPRCTYGCAVLNLTVVGYLRDESDPLASALADIGSEAPDALVSALAPVAEGNEPASLSTSGYVVDSLQTALHDALSAESAEDAIVTAVNRGGDADTIGAIAGAVAGARFGAQDLPERWLSAIDERDELTRLARRLAELEG
jgi:ADP-ribosyl-[dinitrogen reductase] hydrolase